MHFDKKAAWRALEIGLMALGIWHMVDRFITAAENITYYNRPGQAQEGDDHTDYDSKAPFSTTVSEDTR